MSGGRRSRTVLLPVLLFLLGCNSNGGESTLGQWTSLAALAGGSRQEVGVTAAGGKVYVMGGIVEQPIAVVDRVEVYDPQTDAWSPAAPLPRALHHVAAASVGERVYVIGGLEGFEFRAVGTTFEYTPATDTWRERAPLPAGTERGALAVAVINGKIYAAGGLRASAAVNDFAVYDPAADAWQVLPPMPTVRDHLAAGAINGKFLAVGGRKAQMTAHVDVLEEFDPDSNTWRSLASLPTSRGGLAAAALGDRLVVMGGEGNPNDPPPQGKGVFSETEEYNPATDTWRALAPLLTPRHGMGAAVVGDVIYVPGGATHQALGATDINEAFSFAD